ncbi:MFS transporter [Paraburkholderia xenovorans]|uniref:Major facilitator superfamily (MFS) transporter n=1 Tax=Paraburkholderia xenovorans (strain LB400) TaxID=266265 RepID=Q13GK5_PARXL|nr:MFS transporter [Paraburkholderia xenovorans]ABE36784.1 major facilitator superfamily (MFS) transporter [Paraburkholderia xenovorans LB400]
MMDQATYSSAGFIAARLDRLPNSGWHILVRCVVGATVFFDAFDALSIALVLPVLSTRWHLTSMSIGILIASGYVGQAIGALLFGSVAERIGRIKTISLTIVIFAFASLASAFAPNYAWLCAMRVIGGIGLGGEGPAALAYISEIAPVERRGAFILSFQFMYAAGFVAASLMGAWIVPRFGWQSIFIVGSLPIILLPVLRRLCPESPRWFASRGRLEESDAALWEIEKRVSKNGKVTLSDVAPTAGPVLNRDSSVRELFSPVYRKRTINLWILWAATYFVVYGMTNWLPTLLKTVYHLPLQETLNIALLSATLGLCGNIACVALIDRIGPKHWFIGAFAGAAALFSLWLAMGDGKLVPFLILGLAAFVLSVTVSFGLFLYTAEIYPTRMRGIGAGFASFWLRVASVLAPMVIGYLLPRHGISGVFAVFAGVSAIGFLASLIGMIKTKGLRLEDIAP